MIKELNILTSTFGNSPDRVAESEYEMPKLLSFFFAPLRVSGV